MSIDKVLQVRRELVYASGFQLTEYVVPRKLIWTGSCLLAPGKALDVVGTKSLHSRVNITHKVCRERRFPSAVLRAMDGNTTGKDDTRNVHGAPTFDATMDALSSLITSKKRGEKSNKAVGRFTKLERMSMYVKILGLEEDIAGLKVIHVAGTKGKGSTCAFSEAILRECGFKTGLFTSPHLIDVTERFRLDGLDIPKEMFLHYFWECWHQLKENVTEDLPMPPLFQFLTLLAFKIFASEEVDVAIIEVGLGGTTDSTNVIKDPVVCGVSPLGMDHMETLGNTLGQIASHKAGIFKFRFSIIL